MQTESNLQNKGAHRLMIALLAFTATLTSSCQTGAQMGSKRDIGLFSKTGGGRPIGNAQPAPNLFVRRGKQWFSPSMPRTKPGLSFS